jgi:glycerol uptake facilitator-like aquaporin
VTLGALLNRRISLLNAVLYVVVQVLGGTCGALLALAISSPGNVKPFVPSNTGAPWGQIGSAFAVEFLFTTALCLVMQNAALEKNTREPNS